MILSRKPVMTGTGFSLADSSESHIKYPTTPMAITARAITALFITTSDCEQSRLSLKTAYPSLFTSVSKETQKCMVRLVIAMINFDNGVGYALMYSESD